MRKDMKKGSRITALTLSMVMLLSGCGKNELEQSTDNSVEGSSQQTVSSTEEVTKKPYWEMLDEVSDSSELPDWDGDILEVSIWSAGGTDYVFGTISEDNVTFKEFERVTGVRFNLDDSYGNGGESIDAKLPKMIAGKDFPTMVYSWNTPSQMLDLFENGYLVDLTTYYENGTLSELQERIPTDIYGDTYYADMNTDDGKYFLLPDGSEVINNRWISEGFEVEGFDPEYLAQYVNNPQHVNKMGVTTCISVRDDILQALYSDALSMDDIQKIWVENGAYTEEQMFDIGLEDAEDFYQLLYDIQDLLESGDYVGTDGKEMEVTFGPHSETDNWDWMFNLINFLAPRSMPIDYFSMFDANETDPDKFLKLSLETDVYQEYMKDLNQMVNDDVISQNSLVDNGATFTEKVNNGHYAVLYGSAMGYTVDDPNGEWAYRPIWINTDHETDYNTIFAGSSPKYWGIFKDSVTEEQLEQLLHAYNYMHSKVGGLCMAWGPESAGLFEVGEDGLRRFIDAELEANVLYGTDNESGYKYGIHSAKCSTQTVFNTYFYGNTATLYSAKYTLGHEKDRVESEGYNKFVPGILGGKFNELNSGKKNVKVLHTFYQFGVSKIEGLKSFWAARNGFENQLKKTIAASPEKYDTEMQELLNYMENNGITDEAMLEYNREWVAANEKELKDAGYLK